MSDPATAPGPAAPDPARYVAERLLTHVREDIGRADTKASVLLSGALALPVVALTRLPVPGSDAPAALTLLIAAGVLWLLGIGLLIGAVLPRTRTLRSGEDVTFYADALRGTDMESLHRLVNHAGEAPVPWLLTQFRDVSTILARKYRCIRWGVCCLVPGLLVAAVPLSRAA